MKTNKILLSLLVGVSGALFAADVAVDTDRHFDFDGDSCCGSLSIDTLSAKNVKAYCGTFKEIRAKEINAKKICTESIYTDTLRAKDICNDTLTVNTKANIKDLCATTIIASDLYVTGSTRLGGTICQPFKASVSFSLDTTYTLGDPLNFDAILDDPNGNVIVAPFSYTVPVSGYYVGMLQVDAKNFAGAIPVLGAPIINTVIDVNGLPFRQTFTPFLSFHNGSRSTVSVLMNLNAGDVITCRYLMYVMDDINGFIPYVGTTLIEGSAVEADRSVFKIHLLSADCGGFPVPPCEFVPCGVPTPTPCAPCLPKPCVPCCQPCVPCCPCPVVPQP